MLMLADFKGFILSLVPLTNDAIHVYIGMTSYLGICVALRRPLSWWPALLPGALLGLAIEAVDLAQGSDPLWSLKDVLNQNIWPIAVWFVARHLTVDAGERHG